MERNDLYDIEAVSDKALEMQPLLSKLVKPILGLNGLKKT